ncbi:MAG: hypothetical protein IJM81_08450 [Prevotella sp.]|nr:hypothetical protein [Prevotella sp.]
MMERKKYVRPFTEVNTFISRYNICFTGDPGETTSMQLGKANNFADDEEDFSNFETNLWDD